MKTITKGTIMFKIQLPKPYETFGAYMKQFGKNLAYAIPAMVISGSAMYALTVVFTRVDKLIDN